MIASPEAGTNRLFKLVLAPSIVNPRVNRLWLVPATADGPPRMDSPFRQLVVELQDLYAKANGVGVEFSLYALVPEGARHYSTAHMCPDRLGMGGFVIEGKRIGFTVHHDGRRPLQDDLVRLLARCGALLPNRIREAQADSGCTTPIAWWMCAVWKHSKIAPGSLAFGHLVRIEKDPENPANDKLHWEDLQFKGWHWGDPIGASLSAIEAMGLLEPSQESADRAAGVWSPYMSISSFARRVKQDRNARPRSVKDQFNKLEKVQQDGTNKWSFRLDRLDDSLRQKLEGDGPW